MDRLELPSDLSVRHRVEVLSDAIFVPPTRNRNWVVEGGVLDAAGQPVDLARCWHYARNAASVLPPAPKAEPPLRAGRFLYLGHYVRQFGHFLLETTSRLWYLDQDDAFDGVLILAQPDEDRARVEADLRRFLAMCGRALPPLIWTDTPLRLQTLVVPMQASGALDLMQGAPEHRAFIHANFARTIAPEGPDRIYISRTRLGTRHGSLAEEARLESLLQAEGFVPFHPQDHELPTQIARYKAARVIAGVDGSAFHLVALTLRAEQTAVIFQRRPAPEARMQAGQLDRYSGGSTLLVAGDRSGWSPAGVRRSGLSLFGTLSFTEAGRQLREAGVIRERWHDTPKSDQCRILRQIGKTLGADMHEVANLRTDLSDRPLRSDPSRIRLIRMTSG